MADGIEVGELGQDTGNKELVLNFANEIASGKHGEIDGLLIHHDGRLIFESITDAGGELPSLSNVNHQVVCNFGVGTRDDPWLHYHGGSETHWNSG